MAIFHQNLELILYAVMRFVVAILDQTKVIIFLLVIVEPFAMGLTQ